MASEWVNCVTESTIATRGVTESFLGGGKVSKSRYAHQVTYFPSIY